MNFLTLANLLYTAKDVSNHAQDSVLMEMFPSSKKIHGPTRPADWPYVGCMGQARMWLYKITEGDSERLSPRQYDNVFRLISFLEENEAEIFQESRHGARGSALSWFAPLVSNFSTIVLIPYKSPNGSGSLFGLGQGRISLSSPISKSMPLVLTFAALMGHLAPEQISLTYTFSSAKFDSKSCFFGLNTNVIDYDDIMEYLFGPVSVLMGAQPRGFQYGRDFAQELRKDAHRLRPNRVSVPVRKINSRIHSAFN